jgi:hypothetical protein
VIKLHVCVSKRVSESTSVSNLQYRIIAAFESGQSQVKVYLKSNLRKAVRVSISERRRLKYVDIFWVIRYLYHLLIV